MSKISFNINVTMDESWVNHFISFLKRMELDGSIGRSEHVTFYADGDGDFRPKFKFDIDYIEKTPVFKTVKTPFPVYDAYL